MNVTRVIRLDRWARSPAARVIALGALALLAAACGERGAEPAPPRTLVLVTVDRLPRDATRDARRMPFLAEHTASGAWQSGELFAGAESTAGALACLLTASSVAHHGLRAVGAPDEHGLDAAAPPTLAARLHANSDERDTSAAFLALPWLERGLTGLGAAFQRETAPPARRGSAWRSAAELAPAVLAELERDAAAGRRLVWLHLADTRERLAWASPRLPAALVRRLTPFASTRPELAGLLSRIGAAASAERDPGPLADELCAELRGGVGRRRGSAEQAALEAALLDAGLADVDALVAHIAGVLARDPRGANAVVCVAGAGGGSGRGLAPEHLATTWALGAPAGAELAANGALLAQEELGALLGAWLLETGPLEAGPLRTTVAERALPDAPAPLAPGRAAHFTAAGATPGHAAWLTADDATGALQLVEVEGDEPATRYGWPGGGVLARVAVEDEEQLERAEQTRLRHQAAARVIVALTREQASDAVLDVALESPRRELLRVELLSYPESDREDTESPRAPVWRAHRGSPRTGSASFGALGRLSILTTAARPALGLGLSLNGRPPTAAEVACDGRTLAEVARPVLRRKGGADWPADASPGDAGADGTGAAPWIVEVERASAANDWRVEVAAAEGASVVVQLGAWPPTRAAEVALLSDSLDSRSPDGARAPATAEPLDGRADSLLASGRGPLALSVHLTGEGPELTLGATRDGRPVPPDRVRFRGSRPDPARLTLALHADEWHKGGTAQALDEALGGTRGGGGAESAAVRIDWTALCPAGTADIACRLCGGKPLRRLGPAPLDQGARALLPSLPPTE